MKVLSLVSVLILYGKKKKKRLQCYFSFSELFINPMLQKFFCDIQLAVMFIDQAK